jgi:hypothetical protein
MSNQTEYIVGDGSDKGSFLSPVHFVDIPSNAEEAFAKKPVSVKRFSCTGKFLDKLPVFLRESFKIPVFRDELEEYSSSRNTGILNREAAPVQPPRCCVRRHPSGFGSPSASGAKGGARARAYLAR